MLINLRNALMAGKRLPYDAEVEYLESTGTQWIDTGVLANGEFDVEYTIQTPSTFNRNFIVGGARSSTQHLNFGQYELSGNFVLAYLGNYWTALQSISANTIYTTKVHYASGSQTATVNGGSVFGQTYTGTEALNLNIYLFKRNFYGATDTFLPMIGRMYSFKIYQNGNAVRDFIPVRKKTVGYLYDRVSGALFGNAGSGDFVLGPDVVPVEWLEGTGTQYIDTGVKYYADFEIKVKMRTSLSNITLYSGGYNRLERISAALPYWRFRSNGGGTYDSSISITELHTLAWRNGKIYSDGAEIYQLSKPYQNYEMYAFGSDTTAFPCVIYYLDLWDSNDTPVRKFRPVRVGSGSTWEGAMMDTLTRRIYRNAGTGAFGYGNDLKYPIPAE